MYQYSKKPNSWDWKAIAAGVGLGVLLVTMSSWVEAVIEHGADFHYDRPETDWERADNARESSRDGGSSAYVDRNETVHSYQDGKENC